MHNNTNKQQPGQVIDVKKIKEDFEKIIKLYYIIYLCFGLNN